jgi:hypothetical protein
MKMTWLRLPKETSKAYLDFVVYRDLGPYRSIKKVGKRLQKNPVPLARLSKKYEWVKRARDYDAHIDQKKTEAMTESVAEMARREIWHAREYQDALMECIEGVKNLLSDEWVDREILFKVFAQFPKLYEQASVIEHKARGLDKVNTESLLKQEDTRTVKQDAEVQASAEKGAAKILVKEASEPQNILPINGIRRIVETRDKEKETPQRKGKLNRR